MNSDKKAEGRLFGMTKRQCDGLVIQSRSEGSRVHKVSIFEILPPFGRLNDKKETTFQKKFLSSHH